MKKGSLKSGEAAFLVFDLLNSVIRGAPCGGWGRGGLGRRGRRGGKGETHALVEGGGGGGLLVHVDVGDTIFVSVAVWWPRPYMRRFETTSRPISGTSAGK